MLFEDPEALYKCDCPEEPRTPALYSPHEEPATPLFQFDNMEIPNIQIRYSEHELPVTKYECDSPEESRVPTRYSEPDEDVPEEV